MLRRKMETVQAMLGSGFALDGITSDDGTLDVRMTQGETRVTVRFDRDEVRALWPVLFPPVEPDGGRGPRSDAGPVHAGFGPPGSAAAEALMVPMPYGLQEVSEFLRRDARDRSDGG